MKAMILAAGKGERMRPLTNTAPKPLLLIGNKPLIIYHLESLAKAGVTEVIINTWYLGDQIIALLGDGARYGIKIHYSIEDELLDTGGGITNALKLLGNDPFIVLSADIFTNFQFNTLPTQPNALAHLVMVDNPPYHLEGDFCLDKGKIKLTGGNKFTYANIGIYRPEFFVDAPQGAFPLSYLMRKHINSGLVTGQYFNDVWHNIGTPQDLKVANEFI